MVEHFGSTAVPGLGGKGVIDICVVVPRKDLNLVSKKLQTKLGYIYKPDAGVENERLFHDINLFDDLGVERHYHLHLTYPENQNYKESIAFRDYLILHPEEAQKYAEVKKKAVEAVSEVTDKRELKEKYMAVKRGLIQEMIQKALKEQ